jgi:hypothetical protein
MIRIVFILSFLIASVTGTSQENLTQDEVSKFKAMTLKAKGTYQVQIIDTRALPTIPLSLINEIEETRDELKITYLNVSPTLRVKILPTQMIAKNDFILLEQIKHISSKEL